MSQSGWIRRCIRVTYYYYNKRNSKRGLSPDDVTGWRTADDALKGCEVLTITVTVSAYFIHPSGKLELSFNLIH